MKRRILKMLPLFAFIIGAMAVYANPAPRPTHKGAVMYYWFSYSGATNSTDEAILSNYTEVPSEPSCSGATKLCALQTTKDGSGQPQLDFNGSGLVTTGTHIQAIDRKNN